MYKFLLTILFLIITAGIYSFFIEPNLLIVKHYIVHDEQLKGIKIVFAGDFHIKTYQKKRLDRVVSLINEQNADLVLSAGDYVSGHKLKSTLPVEKIAEGISKIKSKYGFYTVLGNHDSYIGHGSIISALKKYSINVLDNNSTSVNINGKTIYIAGIEDLLTKAPDIPKALKDTKNPVILLSHHPDMFTMIPETVNLTLAGHVHGGQVRLPFIGAIIIPSQYGNRYSMGYIEENGKKMIVTKGIGTSMLNIRFNCIPEIVVIDFE